MSESCEKIMVANKREVGSVQSTIECKMLTEQKLDRLLCSTQKVEINSSEVLLKEANITGKIIIDAVYKTDADEISQTSSAFPFSLKVESDWFEPNLCVMPMAKIISSNIESIGDDEIRFNVAIDVNVLGYLQTELNVATDNDCCVKMSKSSATKFTKQSTQKLVDNIELDIKDKIKKVLKVDVQTICKDVQPGNGIVKLNGEDVINVLYVEDDVEPKLKSYSVVKPYSEDIEVGGITKESIVDCFVDCVYEATTNTLEQMEESSKLSINRECCIKLFAFENFEFDSVEDVYSLTHTTLVSTNSYDYYNPQRKLFFQNKIDGTITTEDSCPRIDKVLQNCGNMLKIVSSFVQDDEVVIQGILTTTVLYLNDENSSIESVEVEIPFESKQRIGETNANVLLDVNCVVGDVDVVAKRGRDIFVEAEIKSYVNMYGTLTGALVTNIELQDELPPKTSAMEIYFASAGQTLWDVAKDMTEDMEMLAKFNPSLPDVMNGTEKIICYRKHSLEF